MPTLHPAALVVIIALALTGCGSASEPSDPALVGNRSELCAGRVNAARAAAVTGSALAELRELNTFTAADRAGECALQGADGGALLSVQVVQDATGKALAAELAELAQQTDYAGDDASGVTGDGTTTTALCAVDASYYVRVLGLGGSSDEQRTAALDLARDVASRTAPLK